MKVTYIGRQGDPDFVTVFGFTFERKGAAVFVPDTHPKAFKFVNNGTFKVDGAPNGLVIAPPDYSDPDDVSARSPGQGVKPSGADGPRNAEGLRTDGPTEAEYRAAGYAGAYPPAGYAIKTDVPPSVDAPPAPPTDVPSAPPAPPLS